MVDSNQIAIEESGGVTLTAIVHEKSPPTSSLSRPGSVERSGKLENTSANNAKTNGPQHDPLRLAGLVLVLLVRGLWFGRDHADVQRVASS